MKNATYMSLIFTLCLFFTPLKKLTAQTDKKVTYKYKEFEKVSLGSLIIDGQVRPPNELNIRSTDAFANEIEIYERKHFKDLIKRDSKTLGK